MIRCKIFVGGEEIYEVFAEHNTIEADICKHNKGENEFEMSTLFTCIFEMSDDGKNRLYVSSGSPCEAELVEIDLVSLWE